MTDHDTPLRRRASLEVLRAEAADERDVIVYERLRAGEDPWEFMEDLPTVDELVVLTLRGELITAGGGTRPTRAAHFRMLRQIALEYPGLTRAVWRLAGDAEAYRTWDATVRTGEAS
ncbi:MAG: tryptophan synthase subunit alpha [Microbacterium sp.]|uniref:tryptophan synthase subunit alpha n=1 Tax=Microbacterium sp. TaxID=51671 RepID=UPI003A88FA33